MTSSRIIGFSLFFVSAVVTSATVAQQGAPPPLQGGTPNPPAAGAASAAPTAPAPTEPALPSSGQAPTAQPTATPAPSVQPAPAQAPPPVQPAYAWPGYYPPIAPAPAPAPPPAGPQPGPWFGGWFGIGGPYGADTATTFADFKQGPGGLLSAGYAFVPNFGIGAFFHYNTTKLEYQGSTKPSFDDNSGHVLLYGLEARGIVGSGFMLGWASFGIAFGSGSLSLSASNNTAGLNVSQKEDDSIDFKPMPVLGFGVEAEVVKGLYLGPMFRWYIVTGSKACSDQTASFGGTSNTQNRCTEDFNSISIPDIVFVGVGATFRP